MSKFDLLKAKIQKDLIELALTTTTIFQQRCTSQNSRCANKTFLNCEGIDYKNQCFQSYPRKPECAKEGVKFSSSSGGRFPNYRDRYNLSQDEKIFVCASTKLDTLFKQIQREHLSNVRRVYVGLANGFFRDYPSHILQNINGACIKSYHPANRIWYVQATTGSKNILFVVDLTKNASGHLQYIKNSLISNIDTLGVNDFFGLIIIKKDSSSLIYQSLTRAREQYKNAIKNSIVSFNIEQNALSIDYIDVFSKVGEVFNRPIDTNLGAKCQFASNIVIFISASPHNNTGSLSTTQLITNIQNQIQKWNSVYKIKLFTYKIGGLPNQQVLKQLACKHQGTYFELKDNSSQLLTLIRHYQTQLKFGVNIDTAIWSEPYDDANTRQRMVTASVPIYSYVDTSRYVIGAAGIDVLITILEEQNISEQIAIKSLVKCTPSKPIVLDQCYIQKQRPSYSKCSITQNCTSRKYQQSPCLLKIDTQIFAKPPITEGKQYDCCSLTILVQNIIIGVVCGVLFLIILGVSIFFVRRCYIKKKSQRQREKRYEKKKLISGDRSSARRRPKRRVASGNIIAYPSQQRIYENQEQEEDSQQIQSENALPKKQMQQVPNINQHFIQNNKNKQKQKQLPQQQQFEMKREYFSKGKTVEKKKQIQLTNTKQKTEHRHEQNDDRQKRLKQKGIQSRRKSKPEKYSPQRDTNLNVGPKADSASLNYPPFYKQSNVHVSVDQTTKTEKANQIP